MATRKLNRRQLLAGIPLGLAFNPLTLMQQSKYKPYAPIPEGIPSFPEKTAQLDPALVKAFVVAGHASLDKVQPMLEAEPGLLNACWDWGDGDFETALEGAGHMGKRDIALYLISKGARQNLFCAAMLGQLDFVKAVLEANPDAKMSKGPHGIPLMKHARAGGEQAAAVVSYLESIGLE